MKNLLVWFAKTIFISTLLFLAFFSGFIGLLAGDCGVTGTLKDALFYLLAWAIFVYPWVFGAAILLRPVTLAFWVKTPKLARSTDYLAALMLSAFSAVALAVSGYALMRIVGAHARCGVSIGF